MSKGRIASDRVFNFIKGNSYLGGLPDEVLRTIVADGHLRRFTRGQVLFLRDQPGESAFIVLSGRLKVSNTTINGREVGLNFAGVGDIVGEIALLDGRTRTADVVALEPSEVLEIYRRTLIPALKENPEGMAEIVIALCEKLRIATAIIEDSSHEMEARIAKGLLRLADQHGLMSNGRVRIDLKLSQTDLGNYVGLSRANVNRQLAVMKNAGILEADGPIIVVADMARLEVLAGSGDVLQV